MADLLPPLPLTLSQAIARVEGWYLHGDKPTRGQRNANPGNINYGPLAREFGAVLEDHAEPRFAKFPSPDHGWNCLRRLLNEHYADLTIEEAVNKYAPPVENDTNNYVKLVCLWTNESPSTLVKGTLI